MSSDPIALLQRRRNNLPRQREASGSWPQRILRSPATWVAVVMTLIYAACLAWTYWYLTRPVELPDGTQAEVLNFSAFREAFWLALPTLGVWILLFVWVDRYRPARPLLWWLALGWGGAVAIASSLLINTWAAELQQITGGGDPTRGARAAIFVAPFVEEATKASILFFIAIAVRYRLVSKVSGVVLGGLSAAGFAFVENITYYARAIVFSSVSIGAGDPEEAVQQLVFLRGVLTAFGHPLFTMMTAVGVVVAVRTQSLLVRVLAPLVGYLAAAFLHMAFNFVASIMDIEQSKWIYFFVALPLVLSVVIWVVRQVLSDGRRIRARLDDFVRMGWLADTDPYVFSRLRTRLRAAAVALTYGWRPFIATLRLQRVITELAYLRDAMVRGTVDAAGDARARELVDEVRVLRGLALDDPRGKKLNLPKLRLPRLRRRQAPAYAPPTELQPNPPVTSGSVSVGSPSYSPVDPRWGPPKP